MNTLTLKNQHGAGSLATFPAKIVVEGWFINATIGWFNIAVLLAQSHTKGTFNPIALYGCLNTRPVGQV